MSCSTDETEFIKSSKPIVPFGKDVLKTRYPSDLEWDQIKVLLKRFFDAWGYGRTVTPEDYLCIARQECGLTLQDISKQALIYDNCRFKIQEVRILEYLRKTRDKVEDMYDCMNTIYIVCDLFYL